VFDLTSTMSSIFSSIPLTCPFTWTCKATHPSSSCHLEPKASTSSWNCLASFLQLLEAIRQVTSDFPACLVRDRTIGIPSLDFSMFVIGRVVLQSAVDQVTCDRGPCSVPPEPGKVTCDHHSRRIVSTPWKSVTGIVILWVRLEDEGPSSSKRGIM